MNEYVGKTVALTQCPATTQDGDETALSGLYNVEDFYPHEPSNYVWTPYFVLFPADVREHEGETLPSYDVDAAVLVEQIDPAAHGRSLVLEREMDLYEEQRDMEERFANLPHYQKRSGPQTNKAKPHVCYMGHEHCYDNHTNERLADEADLGEDLQRAIRGEAGNFLESTSGPGWPD